MKSSSLLPVNSTGQRPNRLDTSLPSRAQEVNKPASRHSYRGMDTEALESRGYRSPRASINHLEAIHEIGLTLGEVHEVLRRKASLTLSGDDQDDPYAPGSSHLCAEQAYDPSRQHKHEVRSSGIFTMCYHPFESIVNASSQSTQNPIHSSQASQCSTISKEGPRARDRNHFRLPITPRRPSTASSTSSVSRATPTAAFSIDDSNASTPASSLDGSFHWHVPQLDVGMIGRLVSDLEALERRVSALEDIFKDLKEEVRIWKNLAGKSSQENF
ncbi:MAG: hypothetical protein LQ352_003748 [Teloschistes flavicans]|nr:MAG: hypothetical protein LQ352_003748 [Teloschistes flavicans]